MNSNFFPIEFKEQGFNVNKAKCEEQFNLKLALRFPNKSKNAKCYCDV